VQHGLHLALVVVPSLAMGTGLLIERRKGLRPRRANFAAVPGGLLAAGPPAAGPRDWLPRGAGVVPSARQARPIALPLVVISATGAALTHLVVMPEHFEVSRLYGTFFLCAAILQISWAVIVAYRPTRPALVAGALGSAATVVLWTVSRTLGIPAVVGGLRGGAPESVGGLDVLATTFELVAVVGAILALRDKSLGGGSPRRWPPAAKMTAVTALCVTAVLAFWAPLSP
jgi:hypothetical protein